MPRKVIGLITAAPESNFASRLINGVCSRCQTYGYELAVFGTLISPGLPQEKYLAGEMNIYNLINFDQLDGVVLDAPSLKSSATHDLIPAIADLLKTRCNKPLVSIGSILEDYPSFMASDRRVFQEITEHVIDVHGRRNLYFLTGPVDVPESHDRLNGFKDALANRGIPFDESRVIYGDFWYFGGKALAQRLLSGELPMPDGIVCASDHMAISLTNNLAEGGVRIPEDVVITGFDATREAAINRITITSCAPDCESVTALAVDELRRTIEPDAPILPYQANTAKNLRLGMSCGCNPDLTQIMDQMAESFYNTNPDFSSDHRAVDIGTLIESNMIEYLSDSISPQECIHQIYLFTYLLNRYNEFFLCLDENWLNPDQCINVGYPARIKQVIHNTYQNGSGHYEGGPVFETARMLPELGDEGHPPSVFFFMPVHFLDQSMGYAVLRYNLDGPHTITCVIRNWLKNVNSGLHITRTTHRLASLSTRDGMTGAYNRRGMELMLDHLLASAKPDDSVLAFVIDMDKLKYVNDYYGHADGDAGINAVCSAAMSITGENELCVRAGGDEFYVIGVGSYQADEAPTRMARFQQAIDEINARLNMPYTISASVGSACIPLASGMTVMGIIRIADAKMYENKVQRKLQRKD